MNKMPIQTLTTKNSQNINNLYKNKGSILGGTSIPGNVTTQQIYTSTGPQGL